MVNSAITPWVHLWQASHERQRVGSLVPATALCQASLGLLDDEALCKDIPNVCMLQAVAEPKACVHSTITRAMSPHDSQPQAVG